MFKERLITALLLIPMVVLGVLYAPTTLICCVAMILLYLTAVEWVGLIPLHTAVQKNAFFLLLYASLAVGVVYPKIAIFLDGLLWCILSIFIIIYPRCQQYWGRPVVIIAVACVLSSGLCAVFVYFFSDDARRKVFLYLLCLVWAADTGAYFVGKKMGRHRFIPAVSPGKSIEGLLGGAIAVLLVSCIYQAMIHDFVLTMFIQAMIVFLCSVMGDLGFSMLKRRVQLKDTGQLMPGHGGLLDRIDSLFSAAPIFLGTGWYLGMM